MDPQVLMLAAVVAERTKNIKIGSSIHRPVIRQPEETVSASALPHERYGFDNLMLEDPHPDCGNRWPWSTRSAEAVSFTAREGGLAALPNAGSSSSSTWRS